MKLKWIGPVQYSQWGKFSPGDVLDVETLGIAPEVCEKWITQGYAELIREPVIESVKITKRKKEANNG
jgi:hypothetical protein